MRSRALRGFLRGMAMVLLCFLAVVLLLAALVPLAQAQTIPREAARYQHTLKREAQQAWGLNAPVATFAAQIHQESGWRTDAVSAVGARGLAQFMPETARWWCGMAVAAACDPANPTWAIRALLGYDLWLFQRVRGSSEFDRTWAMLRAYNGGLGHWQQEAALALEPSREAVDATCGKARRAASFCAENLGYPRRILQLLQPLYLTWGRGVAA